MVGELQASQHGDTVLPDDGPTSAEIFDTVVEVVCRLFQAIQENTLEQVAQVEAIPHERKGCSRTWCKERMKWDFAKGKKRLLRF